MNKIYLSTVGFCLLINITFAQSVKLVYKNKNASTDARVKDLLSRMNLEEKVAQMRIFHANLGIALGTDNKLELKSGIAERLRYGIAGIKNPGEFLEPVKAALLNNQLQKYIVTHNRLGIPALFITESYNGVDAQGCTKFARPINMAASFNRDLVHQTWDIIGREARIRGLHMCHSPEADLSRDPRFGRMSEEFGEDTYLTSQMIISAVTGVQGDFKGLKSTHIGAVTKHFAGYGQVLGGTNFAAIEISPRTLIDEIYPPFKAAVQQAKTLGIMASHGDLNGIASHANYDLLTKVLKNQWGFKGYVVSDANDIARLNFFMKVAETPEDAAMMALKAGMDVDLYSDEAYALLPKLVKTHPELIKYIDAAASRMLRTKFILGLFDSPYVNLESVKENVRTDKALAIAKKMDEESMILLKNKSADSSSILPIGLSNTKYNKIALLGPVLTDGAKADFEKIAGNRFVFSAEKGFDLTNREGDVPKLNTNTKPGFDKLIAMAKQADLCVLFLGGDEFTAKEGFFNNALGDRASIDPVAPQDELIRQVKALGKPIIVVLKHRRTLSINEISKTADAILDCWDASEFGDEAIAKAIFGLINPSGKLPVTVPRTIGQLPFHYSQKEINFKKGYLFIENGPLYPFGYGLSYTTFKYHNLKLSSTAINPNSKITVTVEVTNTGKLTGKEVVQLYIKDLIGSVTRPDKELKDFQKVELKAGETKTVSFTINPEILKFTRADMKFGYEVGDYTVQIGPSSAEGLKSNFRLTSII
ncbi:glycoside hydrolase family 3 C-terminal domain-containing protein [Pedobacter sp. SD-b]|uniref:beta-glucosidase n=1 Tax=Pedobacter segetis TaxID=2793069 RepID=A0ABS1BL27_9SPHI|nr:glycoside hydrolase family 3 N-terminal domain-containing protein [Pedobacter segetis]MBK0383594.1 glycoside hydrolase family 3 C-terminal domain-containing protein [Pedobacter segetis]